MKVFKGAMKSGMDRVDYILDQTISASAVKFQILEYNNANEKFARMDVIGCLYEGKNCINEVYS